ncbi:MAG: PEP-CTERM sorting domain-containing protein, partial [Fimbriimonadaceae bacterium]
LQGLDPQLAGFSTNQTSLWLTATNTPTLVGDPVPEPFTMGLVAVGALAAARRTRAKRKA